MRLSEQYIAALDTILSESKIMMIPKGDGNSDNSTFNPRTIAQAMAIYRQLAGPQGVAPSEEAIRNFAAQSGQNPSQIKDLLNKVNQLEKNISNKGIKFQFLDDKALYNN